MPNNRYAHAPYNFVPLVDGEPLQAEIVDHDRYHMGKHTGYFDVTLETVTPLFVRGMLSQEDVEAGKEAKDNPHCFMVDGKPVIPGSSLRGMIRSLVEIVTFGKMHSVGDTQLMYRAVGDTTNFGTYYRNQMDDPLEDDRNYLHLNYPSDDLKAGYLVKASRRNSKDSGWAIRPAQTDEKYQNTFVLVHWEAAKAAGIRTNLYSVISPVWVRSVGRSLHRKEIERDGQVVKVIDLEVHQTRDISTHDPQDSRYKQARIVIAGKTIGRPRHWYTAVFEPYDNAAPITISQHLWQIYQDDLEINRDSERETRRLKENEPIFYLMKNDELYFFGSTMMFRLPYEKTLRQVVLGVYALKQPITDYTDAIFGFVPDDEKDVRAAYAGRIFVTSATLDEDQDNTIHQQELRRTPGSPKPTTFQHYLEQPDVDLAKPPKSQKSKLHHYGIPKAKIRGHKLYWRQSVSFEQLRQDNSDGSKPKIETKFYPVEGTFSFRVYFENLNAVELGILSWVLTLGGDDNAHHMLGMGKPYGMGVVKLTPTLYLTRRRERYSRLFDDQGRWYRPGEGEENAEAISPHIKAFKDMIEPYLQESFEENNRIKELMILLSLQPSDASKFSYMTIQPNEFADRPVLPKPSEVIRSKKQ